MADEEDKESKTEEPSEKKIRDAILKGQTAVSQEVSLLASLAVFTTYVILYGDQLFKDTVDFLTVFVRKSGEIDLNSTADSGEILTVVGQRLGWLLLPLCALLMLGGILASALQNEPRMVLNRIAPKLSKLSLIKGWSRIFGKDGFVTFAKNVSKLLFCGTFVMITLYSSPETLLNGMFQESGIFGDTVADMVAKLLVSVCLAMTIVAIADFLWSRFSWRTKLRMSRKEVTDEQKQAEGDPLLKARMRSVARSRSRQRMMDAVPSATLIIANPTHIAIALRFDANRDDAPIVVAKGQDLIALRIRAIAEANNVPVFEKVELARALNKVVRIDQIIPPDFYSAVAELINIIYRKTANQRV